MSEKEPIPQRTQTVATKRIRPAELMHAVRVIRWARIRTAVGTGSLVVLLFAALTALVGWLDSRIEGVVSEASTSRGPSWLVAPSAVIGVVAAIVFVSQVRHHRASDPSQMLTGTTEELSGRWVGFRTSCISAVVVLASAILYAWSS